MSQTLYRLFDADDRLLYVGISKRAMTRFDEHGRTKPWWNLVERITVEHHETRDSVAQAEREAIRSERPLHNVVHSAGPVPQQSSAKRVRMLREEADALGDALNMGMARTWGLINAGLLNEAEESLAYWRSTLRSTTCPACGIAAHYVPSADRYFHADGSASAGCWRAFMRGGAA